MNFLAEIIKTNQENIIQKKLFRREYKFPYDLFGLQKIYSLIGARRAGKTSIMIQWIQQFVSDGLLAYEDVVFVDYTTLYEYQYPTAEVILEAYHSIYPDRKPWIFLDEVQSDPVFKVTLLRLLNQGYRIFVTGSNSKLLSQELSTELRGRAYEFYIDSLNFREFCIFKGFPLQEHSIYTPKSKGLILNHMQLYLKYGSYPEIALSGGGDIAQTLLDGYYTTLLYRDIQERYGKDVTGGIELLMKQLVLGNTKHVSVHKVYLDLKSQGKKISKDTIYAYLHILEQIFFVTQLTHYYNPKAQHKHFIHDRGYMNLFGYSENNGQKREHIVYKYLKRKYQNLAYMKDKGGELDFISEDQAIQVCYDLTGDNYDREIFPLLSWKGQKKLYLYRPTSIILPQDIQVQTIVHLL